MRLVPELDEAMRELELADEQAALGVRHGGGPEEFVLANFGHAVLEVLLAHILRQYL